MFTQKNAVLSLVLAFFLTTTLHSEILAPAGVTTAMPYITKEQQQQASDMAQAFCTNNLEEYIKLAEHFTSEEYLYPILHAHEIKQEEMRAFRDKLIYKLPEELDILPPPFNNIGIYTKDVIKVIMFGILLAHEHALLTYYKQYIVQKLINHVIETLPQCSGKIHENKERLTPAYMVNTYEHIRVLIPSVCVLRHVQHVVLQQISHYIKNRYLLNEEEEQCIWNLNAAQDTPSTTEPKPIFSLLQETYLLEIPLNIPSSTMMHVVTDILKQFNIITDTYDNVVINSCKDIALNVLFLHYFTLQHIIPRWHEYLEKNSLVLQELIEQQNNTEFKKQVNLSLARFLAPTYMTWLKTRHSQLTYWNSCYLGILMLPNLIPWGKWAYKTYKTINTES